MTPRRTVHFLISALLLCLFHSLTAQEFDADYRAVIKGRPLLTPTLAADGNYLVGGSIDFFGDDLSGSIIKITPKGQRVTGFNKIVADGDINHILPLSDGRFMASGKFTRINGQPVGKLVRFNADGSVDETFNTNTSEEIRAFNVQSTGKIIISGQFENYMGKGYREMARLNPDGSLDETFGKGSPGWATEITINDADEILLSRVYSLIKLTADGAVDATFNVNLGTTISFHHTEFLLDGKVLVASYNYTTHTGRMYRLHEDGSIDTDFFPFELPQQILTFARIANGEIVIAGIFSRYNEQPANLILLNPDGTFNKIVATTSASSVHAVFKDDAHGLVVAGEFHSINGIYNPYIARLSSDLTVDAGFKTEITRSFEGPGIGIQSDGKLIVAGTHSLIGSGSVRTRVIRLNENGAVDPSFVPALQPSSHLISFEVQPDNKVLVGGLVLTPLGDLGFLRLMPDGSRDASFNIGTGPTLNSGSTRPDVIRCHKDKIYLGGNFTHFNGQAYPHYVILDKDGEIVGPANKVLPSGSTISDIEVQSDGKVVLVGFFPFAGGSNPRLIRLLADGSLDPAFPGIPVANGLIRDIALDSHDRIVVIGAFEEFNGTTVRNMARLNNDGTVDATFNTGDGVPQDVYNSMKAVRILPTDIIAIAGSFDFYKNESTPGILFLTENGDRLPFFADINPISDIWNMAFRNNTLYGAGRIVYGHGEDVSSVMRVHFDLPVSVSPDVNGGFEGGIPVYPNPFGDVIYLDAAPGLPETAVKIYSQTGVLVANGGKRLGNRIVLDVGHLPQGIYIVNVASGSRAVTKLVKR